MKRKSTLSKPWRSMSPEEKSKWKREWWEKKGPEYRAAAIAREKKHKMQRVYEKLKAAGLERYAPDYDAIKKRQSEVYAEGKKRRHGI